MIYQTEEWYLRHKDNISDIDFELGLKNDAILKDETFKNSTFDLSFQIIVQKNEYWTPIIKCVSHISSNLTHKKESIANYNLKNSEQTKINIF